MMKTSDQFLPAQPWEWKPLWHDQGESLLEFIEFVRSQESGLSDNDIRSLWIGAAMSIMDATYYDLMIAQTVSNIEDQI